MTAPHPNPMPNTAPTTTLCQCTVKTPLGNMLAIANDSALCLLEFLTRPDLQKQIAITTKNFNTAEISKDQNHHHILKQVQAEINAYFKGTLTHHRFQIPLDLRGTPYQLAAWQELQQIPFGQTITYSQLSNKINDRRAPPSQSTSARAAGNANAANRIAIIVPCHRVVRSDHQLAGYAGGITRKRALLDHEEG